MSSLSFTKLFSSITDSSVWGESSEVRIVWVTMLAMADPLGRIHAAIPGLAHRARVTVAEAEKALAVFLSPDPYSRSKDHDGRRIEEIEGGWRLLNYSTYREKTDADARKEKNRIYQQRFRDKVNQNEYQDDGITGYIYYAQNGGHLKIGFSKNPWTRISELRCACPTLDLVGLEKGTMQDEKYRHEMFAHLRHEREWFRLENELIDYIKSLPLLEKLTHGRYRNEPPNPIVQTVVSKRNDVSSYVLLRPTTKAQEEVEVEAEEEEEASTSTNTSTLASSSDELPAVRGILRGSLPLTGNRTYEVRDDDFARDGPLYPGIDLGQEYRAMKAWLLANPKHQKTPQGIRRFMNNWLSKAQDRSKPQGGSNGNRNHGKTAGNLDAAEQAIRLLEARDNQASDEVCGASAGTGEPFDVSDFRGRLIELSAE